MECSLWELALQCSGPCSHPGGSRVLYARNLGYGDFHYYTPRQFDYQEKANGGHSVESKLELDEQSTVRMTPSAAIVSGTQFEIDVDCVRLFSYMPGMLDHRSRLSSVFRGTGHILSPSQCKS
jgi:hypothetical protein